MYDMKDKFLRFNINHSKNFTNSPNYNILGISHKKKSQHKFK